MMRGRILLVAGCFGALSACAVSSVGAPVVGSTISGVKIAQCGSPGAAPADISFPPGWFERIAAAETRIAPVDELLGGLSEVPDTSGGSTVLDVLRVETQADEGICEVLFDTTSEGAPVDILTACSRPDLLAPARDAVADTRVAPRFQDGQAVGRKSVVYPVRFCADG